MVYYVASSSQRISAGTTTEGLGGLTKCADGSLFAAWRKASAHGVSGTGEVNAARSTDGGATWTSLGVVLNYGSSVDERDIGLTTLADGRVMMQFFINSGAGVAVAFSSDHGSTWSTPALVPFTSATTQGCSSAPVQLPSGDILVAMYGGSTSNWSIRTMRSTDNGATWGDETTIADGDADSRAYSEPWLGILPSGDLMVLIRCDTDSKVYRSVSTDDGVTWSTPAAVTAAMSGLGRPSWIAGYGGSLIAFNRDATTTLWAKSIDDGVTWSTWYPFGRAGILPVYAQATSLGGGVYGVAYGIEGGTTPGVHYMTFAGHPGSNNIIFADDFDAQAAWPPMQWSAAGTGALSTATRTGTGQCITASGAQVPLQKYGLGNTTSKSFGFYYKIAALPGSENYIAGFTNDNGISSAAAAYLRLLPTGAVRATFRTVTTVYGTSSAGVIVAGQWHRIDCIVTYGASGTGAFKVRVDGVEVINATGITVTVASGPAGIGGCTLASHAGNVAFDDVTITDDANYATLTDSAPVFLGVSPATLRVGTTAALRAYVGTTQVYGP